MNNFSIYLPTKIKFGKETINKLSLLVKGNYKKVLIHYGGGSIKRSGLYDEVVNELKKAGADIYELGGVKPNPRLSLVREGIELAKKEGIDLILAVGGGSAIDSAKAIALGAVTDVDVWDFYLGNKRPERALPVGVVLTYPATGSEASMGSVITNEEEGLKLSVNDDLIRPTFAIMDPTYTLTLPRDLTFAGISDILSHVLERYFTNTPNVDLTDHLCEATMRSVIKNARILNENLDDYNARAEIMLAGTIAHNGILGVGREEDWSSHNIGHQLSALYGTTHGVTLSIIFPAWMKYVYKDNLDRFNKFAVNVFDISDAGKSKEIVALEGIKAYEDFLKEVGLPTSFKEANLPSDKIEEMGHKAVIKGKLGGLKKLDVDDIIKIYELAL
jgi:hypothetical protein